jgi:hypothetical protein
MSHANIFAGAVVCALLLSLAFVRYQDLDPIIVPGSSHLGLAACERLWQRKIDKHMHLMRARRAALSAARPNQFFNRTSYDPFEPTYTCHSEYRRGKDIGDGGKFVCGEADYFKAQTTTPSGEPPCLMYSVGSYGDAQFEHDIKQNFGCEIHTFDPTGNSTRFAENVERAGATFHAIGVDGSVSTMWNPDTGKLSRLLPITDIVNMLGHAGRHIHILKIDCEGCEYAAFKSLWGHIKEGAVTIGQIQIELHRTDFGNISSFFEGADDAGYMIFHKERNHWGCQGFKCVEYSLIHEKEAKGIYQHTHCQ